MTTAYPPYKNFPMLISNQIVLRQVINADADEIMEISYYDGIQASNPNEAIEMQKKINQDYFQGDSIHWGIVDAQSSKLVGTCGYYRGFANNTGELGYVLKPSFEGRGYMTNALKKAIEFGIDIIRLHKIIAITEKSNIKSQNVLKRLNFVQEAEQDDYITYTYQRELLINS
ncbi:GNAT family N-acetyltransferase [Pedobacter sp.]|uniref:GNAT family N-acetyltransferase n=1 Tax=Pedobacter sp. TaxID=1411316 RepID=UPI003D7FDF06